MGPALIQSKRYCAHADLLRKGAQVGNQFSSKIGYKSRRGGTGRRAGLKILLWQHSTGSIPVAGIKLKVPLKCGTLSVRVAQLDRASGYGPEGRGFESCHAHLKKFLIFSETFFVYFLKKRT